MASSRRTADLRASLERELESVSRGEMLDSAGRLRWLRGELENYLDRWLAFAAVENIPMTSLLSDDLFAMVLVGSDLFEQQPNTSGGTEEWRRFRSALSRVQAAKDRSALAGLRDALIAVGAALHEKRG